MAVVCCGYLQLQDLPVEMLEMILLKCCMWRVLDQWEATAYVPSGNMYRELATVWSEWWFRMTRNWFIITLKKRLRQLSMDVFDMLYLNLPLNYCIYKRQLSVSFFCWCQTDILLSCLCWPFTYMLWPLTCDLKVHNCTAVCDVLLADIYACICVLVAVWLQQKRNCTNVAKCASLAA